MCVAPQQLHSRSVPQDLTYYDNFTLPEMAETDNNIIVIQQTAATHYIIDGLDDQLANGCDGDDNEILNTPLLSKSTTAVCLFCVIPTMSMICILIFILETIAISKSENNRYPQGVDAEEGATMTPEDYYTWISKRKDLQRNSTKEEDKFLANNKRQVWTWIGVSVLISSILMVLSTKVMLLLLTKNRFLCCSTSGHESKRSTAGTAAAATTATKGKAEKNRKKKRCHYKNPMLMGSLLLSMMGTLLVVMGHVLLASGKPVK